MTDHTMRPHAGRPLLRPRSLSDLVELVPYLLGFHPHDSLVVVGLHGPRRRVGTTVRVDRAQLCVHPDLPTCLATYLRATGADEALAVVYADGEARQRAGPYPALPDRKAVQELARRCADAGLLLVDGLYVEGGRWWSYACGEPWCCPPAGRVLPTAAGRTSPVVAAATFAGLVALPDRAALERTLDPIEPVPLAELDRVRAAVRAEAAEAARAGRSRQWRAQAAAQLAAVVADVASGANLRLTDAQVARLLALLSDQQVRDVCCEWTDGRRAGAALELWRYLARRAVPPHSGSAFALVAWSAWHLGAGPLARMAVDRALSADPDCRLAVLLDEALDRGVNPMTTRGRQRGRRQPAGG